ncbi:hypothetical protein JCM1840_000479 [Sporobolomyces johnsonii]
MGFMSSSSPSSSHRRVSSSSRPSTPPPRNPARPSLSSAQSTPTARSRSSSTAAPPGSSSSTTALPQRSSPLIGGSLAKRKPPHGRARSKTNSISLADFASGAVTGPGPTVGTVNVASPSSRPAQLPSTTGPGTPTMERSRSPSSSGGRRSPSPSADPSDSDDLSRLSRERLVALLRQTQGDLASSQDRVEVLEQGQRGHEDERRRLERELDGARTRADELLVEEGRMEEELAGRIEVLEKLRATVRELERDKREATKRYREQADSFDSERQAWYDQEQHYKVRIANLSSSSKLRSRGGVRSSLGRADEGEENNIEANGTSENEPQSDAEGIDEPKTPTSSHLPPRSSTASPSPSFLSASSTPSQPTSTSDQPTTTELALRAQLDSLSTAHTSLTTTLRTLQTEMADLKRVYQDLQEENESYEILLGEKTLSGEVTGSDFFRRSFTWGESGAEGPAAGGWSGVGFEGGLEAVGEEELEDDSEEEDSEGSDSDDVVGKKFAVEDDGEGSEDIEAILLESKGTGSLNSGAVSATSPNPSRRRSRRQQSISIANAPHKKHASLPSAGMVPSSSGLDLAAELEMAQKTEEMDEVEQERKREREERRKKRREEKERKRREKKMLGRRESSGGMPLAMEGECFRLQREIKQLREANKALTLYVSKIVDRVCSQEGFEKVLAVDYRSAPTPKTAADISPELARREPSKKVRPSSGFFGRAAQEPSTLTTVTAQSVGLSATLSSTSSVGSTAAPGPRKSGGLSWDGFSSVFGFGSSSSAASTTSGAARSRSTTLTSTPSHASHVSHSSLSAPGMKPLMLSAEGAARKLDVDEEDEDDMRERERLRAEMAQHGIAYAPALALAGSLSSSSSSSRPRLSPRLSSSSASSTASLTPPTAAAAVVVAEKQLKTLEQQEEEAKAELKEGRSSGFTEPPQRRMSRIERRSSTRSSVSLSSGGSATPLGLGIKDAAGEAARVVEAPTEGDKDAASGEADGPIGKALKRLSRGWASPTL